MPPVNTAPPIVVTPLAQTDTRTTTLAPGFVRVPGIGYVHKSVVLLVTGALGYMAFRRISGRRK